MTKASLLRTVLAATTLLTSAALTPACEVEDPSSSEENLTAAGKKLIGAYQSTGSTSANPPSFLALVLTSEAVSSNANRFFADVDTGIRCVTEPCPSTARIEGRFTAGSKTITLTAEGDNAADFEALMGKYDYKKTKDGLKLTRKGTTHSFGLVDSYCAPDTVTDDCDAQNLITPSCLGSWSCSAENTCGWDCGTLPSECDGFAGIQCDIGMTCRHPDGTCNVADMGGECVPVPKCNTTHVEPVCGCNGTTFTSRCMAVAAGVQVDHEGECE
jgi:hypothetical protein